MAVWRMRTTDSPDKNSFKRCTNTWSRKSKQRRWISERKKENSHSAFKRNESCITVQRYVVRYVFPFHLKIKQCGENNVLIFYDTLPPFSLSSDSLHLLNYPRWAFIVSRTCVRALRLQCYIILRLREGERIYPLFSMVRKYTLFIKARQSYFNAYICIP